MKKLTVPFCPDCGCAGIHADSCAMAPDEPVHAGNFEEVVPLSFLSDERAVAAVARALYEATPVLDRPGYWSPKGALEVRSRQIAYDWTELPEEDQAPFWDRARACLSALHKLATEDG